MMCGLPPQSLQISITCCSKCSGTLPLTYKLTSIATDNGALPVFDATATGLTDTKTLPELRLSFTAL
jgi:hypothetical protein